MTTEQDPFARQAPQRGDRALAELLHDECCEDDSCGGWDRVSSFAKDMWLDTARKVIASVPAPDAAIALLIAVDNAGLDALANAEDGALEPEWQTRLWDAADEARAVLTPAVPTDSEPVR